MIKFSKYNSCGNDFIIIDNRLKQFSNTLRISSVIMNNQSYIKSLCDRKTGIGADGLILIDLPTSPKSLYFMTYYNSDGLVSSFCGNGSMCCAHFISSIGIAGPEPFSSGHFETNQGLFSFEVDINNNKSKVSLVDVTDFKTDFNGTFIDTGSPHYVMFKNQLNNMDVNKEGAEIRYSKRFRIEGTNVTFAQFINNNLFIRTYERGVEAETLSCGTGAVAAALCAFVNGFITVSEVLVKTKGGDLKVSFKKNSDTFSDIYLQSEIEKNFEGLLPKI
tara:strand:+ start:677 stop:1504 length:828 start_codon:yes stop_codon:yes gene_type:complete